MAYLARLGLIIGAAVLFAGCAGGSQLPLGTSRTTPANNATEAQSLRHGSWMLASAKESDLLYASNTGTNSLIILSYPKGKLVGQIVLPNGTPAGLCSDNAGDVWVAASGSVSESFIYEYAHGGTNLIATLDDPGFANGCAVDPSSGNLAVTNYFADDPPYNHGDVAVYQDAEGTPTTYSDSNLPFFSFCTYDNASDLFATGSGLLDELPIGGDSLQTITLNKSIAPLSIQWDAARDNLAVADSQGGPRQPAEIYQVTVSGTSGDVAGPTTLKAPHNRTPGPQFFIQGGRIVGAAQKGENLAFWRYQEGGRPVKIVHQPGGAATLYGIVISVAPPRTHARSTAADPFHKAGSP